MAGNVRGVRAFRFARSALLLSCFAAGIGLTGRAEAAIVEACHDESTGTPANEILSTIISAASAELSSSAPDRGDRALKHLAEVTLGQAAAQPSPLMAEACYTAGRAMRIAQQGSAREAKLLLVSSYRRAQRMGNVSLAGKAALELGMTTAAEGVVGATGGVRAGQDDADQAARAEMEACAPRVVEVADQAADFLTAATALECAAATAMVARDDLTASISNLRLARLELDFGGRNPSVAELLRDDARDRLFQSLAAALRIQDRADGAEVALRATETLVAMRTVDARVADALERLKASTQTIPGLEAYRLAMASRLAGLQGRPSEQRRLISQAVFTESQQSQPLRLATWYLDMAKTEPARRADHVGSAYRALESVRPLMPQFDPYTQESTFQLRMRDVFEAAAEVALARDVNDASAIDRAQQIIERYRQAELQNVFGSECVPSRDPLRPAALKPGEIILYPVLLPDRVELIYATAGAEGFRRLVSPVSSNRREVQELVEAFVRASSTGNDGWQAPGRRLHDLLIKPVLAQAGGAQTLIIVPDGPLRALPFSALQDASGRFLVEQAQVVTAPALGYSEPGNPAKKAPAILALSLAKEVKLPAGDFPRLEGTVEEAKAAAGTTGTLIPDFTKRDLVQALSGRSFDVLHLSTHASFNGRADRAFIVANGEAIQLGELRDLVADNQVRGQELYLLVLAACETAVGDDQASMGLAGAAVQAGAESAVASLWQVNDLGTAKLMQSFYDRLRQGRPKAEALRSAQLSLIQSGADYANPAIWSAFILIGGWR
jgi:CHAT domain-containing protein